MATKKQRNKGAQITRQLAAYFLSLGEGESIASVRALSNKLGASLGLISETISTIEKAGCVIIDRRGQLGSSIKSISIGKLWKIAADGPLVVAHTLPSNRRYEGLATALKMSLQEAGIETYFIFIRGSRTRIKALREGRCHIAITSRFAADGLCGKKETNAITLPAGSFVSEHLIFKRADAPKDPSLLTIAVDPDSFDQIRLSEIEFENHGIAFKQINFMNIFHYLSNGQVNAAIWTEDDMRKHLDEDIIKQPLSAHTRTIAGISDTQASLILRKEDSISQQVIKKVLNSSVLMDIQNKVINGDLIPEY